MADSEKTTNIHLMVQYNIWFNICDPTIVFEAKFCICILGDFSPFSPVGPKKIEVSQILL